MPEQTTVMLRRAGNVEVPRLDAKGRPSYVWVQGWTYTTPRGGELCPLPLRGAMHLARADFPTAKLRMED